VEQWCERTVAMRRSGLGPRAIYDRPVVEEPGFRGSLAAIKRLCLRLAGEEGPSADDVAIPVERAPGEVAQVDFGYAGMLWDPETGRQRKAWVFVMVLGRSRHRFDRVVFDQKQETWCNLHMAAFKHFGGVPKVIVPDTLKAAVIRTAFAVDDRNAELNRSYRELALHYGFRVDPTPPRSPKKKGKVENGVRYVKNNALNGRAGDSIEEVNEALRVWCLEVASRRNHGTIPKKPLEAFLLEWKSTLSPLPEKKYVRVIPMRRTRPSECYRG
jgi:transposase